MRKNAGFMIFTLLLLIVPALANAWTLTVKVSGGDRTVQNGNYVEVVNGTAVNKVFNTTLALNTAIQSGTTIVYPKSTDATTVTIKNLPGQGLTYRKDNEALITEVGTDVSRTITFGVGTSGNHTVVVTYKAADLVGFTLNQDPAGGGVIYAQLPNNTWTTGSPTTGYKAGIYLPVTVAADANHKIVSINGSDFVGGTAGQVLSDWYVKTGEAFSARFALAPRTSAILSAPTNGVAGKDITCTVTATSNDTGLRYFLSTDNGVSFPMESTTGSFTFALAENTYRIVAKVTSETDSTGFKTPAVELVVANAQAYVNSDCTSCHSSSTPEVLSSYNSSKHKNDGEAGCKSCHTDTAPHIAVVAKSNACANCHSGIRTEFRATAHWNNHLEYGPEFAGGKVAEQINPNESWTTTENGALTTCSTRCHFKPNLGPNPDAKDSMAGTDRPGKDECVACHEPHNPGTANYQTTCMTCHNGSKHGKVPQEFWKSKHWSNNFEYGPEFAGQIDTSLDQGTSKTGGSVKNLGTKTPGYINANDSYTTTENGGVVTCAYRCHFRPGMYPAGVTPPAAYVANGKSITYTAYTDATGKYGPAGTVYSRPGGNACMACHDPHGLEANAQNTCYTCHAGSVTSHGWSVAAFEKSSHFTGEFAKAEGMAKESCLACHNAHSTEAEFANLSSAKTLHTAGLATGCQKCHTPGSPYGIFNSDRSGKAPHFQAGAPKADGYYATGSYDGGGSTCVDCHYHNNTINAGWAKGGHASTTSVPLVTSADDNWNRGTKRGTVTNGRTYTGDYTVNAQVSDCQRCHTAKGFIQFYDSAFKNVSTVAEGSKTSAPITCDACHVPKTAGTKLYQGKVRPLAASVTNVKTYVGNAKYLTAAADAVTTSMDFPANYGNSNVCIPCHAGRGTGALIKASFAAGTVIGDESSDPNTTTDPAGKQDILRIGTAVYAHFASAAGVVNGSSAYEFSAPTQANMHSLIGTGAAFGTKNATMGPCAGCHMTSTEGHSLEAVTYDATKKINGIATTVCVTCHGTSFTAAEVQAKKDAFEAALNVLRNMLLNRGFDGLQAEINARPGERVKMNMALGYNAYKLAGGTLSIKEFAERNTGAAFNWWQFGKTATVGLGDPAAYVHNPTYARKIIFDSIDWLDNFKMDNSTATTIQAQANAPVKTYGGVADGVVTTPADAVAALEWLPVPANHSSLSVYKTQYVAGSSVCASCHNPSETTLQKEARLAWAESGHGDTSAAPWTPSASHLWPTTGSTANFATTIPASDCVRCHTADGFVQFATGATPFTSVKNLPGDGKTSSPLNCQGCHVDPLGATSARLAVGQVTTFYNLSTVDKVSKKTVKSHIQATFPNVGDTNLCIPCHTGRINGANINALATSADWTPTKAGFQNSHYAPAAGLMYAKIGFINFTSMTAPIGTSTYGKSLTSSDDDVAGYPAGTKGLLTSKHRRLGTTAIVGAEAWIVAGANPPYSTGGPCVTCHVNANVSDIPAYNAVDGPFYNGTVPTKRAGAGHSFAMSEDVAKQVCITCHGDDAAITDPATAIETKNEEAKVPFNAALAVIKKLLSDKYKITYDNSAYPYVFDPQVGADLVSANAVADWTRAGVTEANTSGTPVPVGGLTKVQAARLMGAVHNLNVLAHDPGAFVHARTYVQRLLFDTIDYLDDLQINRSAAATLVANDAVQFPDSLEDRWLFKAGGVRK